MQSLVSFHHRGRKVTAAQIEEKKTHSAASSIYGLEESTSMIL